MFQTFSLLHCKRPRFRRVSSILTQIFIYTSKNRFSTEVFTEKPKTSSFSKTNQTHKYLTSSNYAGIAKSVISKCSHILGTNKGDTSIKDYFLRLSSIKPEITRRFWRFSEVKPQDILEILLSFESDGGKYDIEVKKVESLWGIFKWATEQTKEFEHIPQSCKIMASMLVRVGLYREVESLLSRRESQGILLDCEEIFSNLIQGYLVEFELDRAISVYEKMRKLALVPSSSSYLALIKYLIELHETQLMHHVYLDMIKNGMKGSLEEKGVHENVIRLLCIDGKVQEARDIIKKAMNYGIRPSNLVINAITRGYCDKKDYSDILSFFSEIEIAPDVILGNKILFSLSKNYGVEQASTFLEKLEEQSFCLDETSLGILIGFCCHEGKLKDAFVYISEILSRGLKPHLYSYNALLSGMFKGGMWKHSRDILLEMNDIGVTPNFSTYKIFLAGFCKFRQFDEVKAIVSEMADHNLVEFSSFEDPLSKGFVILGFDPLAVKIRRDDDKGLWKAEFYDNLGNGLYLDTNVDEYERRISEILDDAMIPDFNSFIVENSQNRDIEGVLTMVDEIIKWGQEISLPAFSCLFKCLCSAPFGVQTIYHYLGLMTNSTYELDWKSLNMLVQICSKKGLTFKARTLFDGMVRKGYTTDNATYSALLFEACKKGDLRSYRYFFELARKSNWSPQKNDFKALFSYMCNNKWFNEAALFVGHDDFFDNFVFLVKELCCQGFTSMARILFEEFSNQDMILDHQTSYSCIVSGFCEEKRYEEAIEILEIMVSEKLSPHISFSTKLISHLCRNCEIEKALELKNVFLRDQQSDLLPINCALINGFCKVGHIQEAVNLFKEVLLMGLFPNSEIFNSLIEGYCGENNFKKVREILGFMIKKNLRISISSYSKMVRLNCKEVKSSLAISLKELMLLLNNSFPEITLYNILIFHISTLGKSFLLAEIIDTLHKERLHFDDVTYNYVVQGFLMCDKISISVRYLEIMITQDIKPSKRSIREVIARLCHNPELIGKALNLSKELEERGFLHSSVVQTNIVEGLICNNNLEAAVQFLNRMVLKDLIPEKIDYDYLIKRFYQCGRIDKSVELLNTMLKKGSYPNPTSYDYIIQGLCNGNKLDKALDFHAEMMCRDLKPSLITWDILVCRLCQNGRVEEGEKLIKKMIEFGEIPSKEGFNAVIKSYKAEKNVGKTAEMVKVMQEKGYVPDFDTHWSVISNLSNSSKRNGKNSGFLSGLLSGFEFGKK